MTQQFAAHRGYRLRKILRDMGMTVGQYNDLVEKI